MDQVVDNAFSHAIETHGLSKTYKGRIEALKAVDLNVRAGSIFGLLGPNGAGKSTLVKVLLSIVRASAGNARVLGQDFRNHEARRAVGYLPEGHRFPRYLTGWQVCWYFGRLAGIERAELKHDIDEKLELVDMSQWARTKISKYSKGMAQRVGLAQAMLGKPKLIFLDEPTDGVDPIGRREIRDVIKGLKEHGATIFLNSHLLSEVEQVCDEVAIMNKGRIIRQGSVEAVSKSLTDTGGVRVRFVTSPVSPSLWQRLQGRGAAKEGEGFEISLPARDSVCALIDELRKENVSIYAVEPQRANLEDAFVELIKAEDDSIETGHPGRTH
ncbi:MAG: ABC transporter ATP-binding protein [Planctomycetaceae bacterium]|nr:ABC transporter ATP-binding protein [Planctomycetaceae bacterium]